MGQRRLFFRNQPSAISPKSRNQLGELADCRRFLRNRTRVASSENWPTVGDFSEIATRSQLGELADCWHMPTCHHPPLMRPTMTGDESNEPNQESDVAEQQAGSSGKTVLIVDDDFEIIESVRYAMENEGHTVVVARDGNQGLALAERENPDLMILDMMMPKRSGFLVLEKLRRLRDEPLPVIMITGNEGSRHKAYAELLGVSDYIRKPFAMDRLVDAVAKLLGS